MITEFLGGVGLGGGGGGRAVGRDNFLGGFLMSG